MAVNSLPSIVELRQLLEYEPLAGTFMWKARSPQHFADDGWFSAQDLCDKWNRNYAGGTTFQTPHSRGYLTGRIGGRPFYAHRVAWALYHGAWPTMLIDHIDRDRTNNRIANLRQATFSENSRNRASICDNPMPGLRFRKDKGVWRVRGRVNGVERSFGQFSDYADAAACWSANFGEAL